jgi:hypothetical protein
MGFELDTSGFSREIERLKKEIPNTAKRALKEEATKVFMDTQTMVPKDTDALMLSGRMDMTADGFEIKYGDSEVDGIGVYYAAAVHDRHAKHVTGQMKYVETPLMEHNFERPITEAVQRVTG